MTIDREKLKRMHDVMQQNGYTQDYATFEKKFAGNDNYANRKKVYDLFSQNGADVGKSYDEFMARLQAKPTAKPQQAAKPTTPKQPAKTGAPRKPMTVDEMRRQVSAELANGAFPKPQQAAKPKTQQSQDTPEYLKQWNLLNKPTSQMTHLERSQAESMRSRMQDAARQEKQKREAAANPIERSRVDTRNPMRAANPQPYTDTSLDMEDVMESLSSPEARRKKTAQLRKDNWIASASSVVNDNKGLTALIDATVEESMKEASDEAKKQYGEVMKKMSNFASQYQRDQVFKDAQDLEQELRPKMLAENMSAKLQEIFSDPELQKQLVQSAYKAECGIKKYVEKYVVPQIMQRAQQVLGVKNIEEIMPGGALGYIGRGLSNSILGTIIAPSAMSRSTRQRMQEGLAISEGLQDMPKVKGYKDTTYRAGIGARFLSTATNMAVDALPMGIIGGGANLGVDLGKNILIKGLSKVGLAKAGAKLTAQQLGFKVANMTMAQKIGSGLLEGSAKGALNLGGYSGITAALGQASTGDDTSLSAIAQAGWEGAKHGAATGAMFGTTGAVMAPWIQKFGINGTETTRGERLLHGTQKAGATALGVGVEAGTMMVADNVTGDKEISVGQWLEDVVMVGAFKAGDPKNYAKIGSALYGLTHNTNNTFRFGKDSDGKERLVDIRLSDAEKNELINSTSGKNLMDAYTKVDKNNKDNAKAYQEFMADENVSQSTKEKVNAAMGLFNTTRKRSYRSVNDVKNKQVLEYASDGTLLTRTSYKNAEERRDILYRQKTYRDNEDLLSLVGYAKLKERQFVDKDGYVTDAAKKFLTEHGYDFSKEPTDPGNAKIIADMKDAKSELRILWNEDRNANGMFASAKAKEAIEILRKDPLKRTDEEVQKLKDFKTELETSLFPEGEPHTEQSHTEGRAIAEEEGLGSDKPNPEPVVTALRNLSEAEDALQELMNSNDVFKESYETYKKQGLTNPQIYDAMIQQAGLTEEVLEPFARYLNANARVQGMQQATQEAIELHVESMAGDWGFHGTMDGQKANGEQMLYVRDSDGRTLIVGSGEVAYDPTTGRAKEGVGDMLVCLDVQTREPVYIKVEDTTLAKTQSVEDFKNEERQRLQQINSAPYNQAAQEQAAKNAAKPQAKEEEPTQEVQPTEQVATEQPKQEEQSETVTNSNQLEKPKEGNIEIPQQTYTLSDKKAGNGEQFYQDESGNIDLASIPDEVFDSIGYTKAPFRLTPSMIRHMLDRHNKELKFKDESEAIHFVRDVMANFDHVRLGSDGALVFSIENGRNRTGKRAVTILINSDNGQFYGLKTSGYEGIKGLERRPLLWERGANKESSSTDAASANVTTSKSSVSGEQSGSASNQSIGLNGKDTNNSSNDKENNTSLTFEDGTPVPMVKDSKGRPTPDYGNMKPEQAAEVLTKLFGEHAEKVVDGQIKKAEKAVKDANKMKVDYSAEPNDILEQQTLKDETVAAASKQLEHAKAVKKAITAQKVAATLAKEKGKQPVVEGANKAGSVAAEKFQSATRLVGNKRSRTLPNGETIKGHYEIVPAESLTPSHDATNRYKKAEGFPVNEDGRTVNDRDYENNKRHQEVTDQMALAYDGRAVDAVPTVSDEGIVYDGNGRTMAGQKAAKEGKDGKYIDALLENAENYGFSREQIEQSGIEHPRLVMVTDERLPYDSKTFAKFNKEEKKSEGNTEQAVAHSKTLTEDEVGAIIADIDGNGSLDAFFNNPKAINDLIKTLVSKDVIGQNEVAGLMEGTDRLSPQGKEMVKNILLGSIFKEDTIRMLGIEPTIKNKAIAAIRSVMDNVKLGEYSLRDEIDKAVQLFYEARTNKMSVNDLLRSSDFVQGNARDRYSEISQALAQALEGKASLFRELMAEYNDVARVYDTKEGNLSFYAHLDKDELIKQFIQKSETIKQNNIKLYGEEGRRNTEKKNGDVSSGDGQHQEEAGGRAGEEKPAESQQRVDAAVKKLATEIAKQTGVPVHTDEKESQRTLEEAEATDSNVKYHKETDKEVLDELNNGETVKVYRAMQVIDGKLYPPMAASVDGKLVEANELGVWIRADENPDLAIPDIDPKTGKQKVDPKTGELKWKFKLDKGGKDATGKKATSINAAYNPYWHMSRSPLNDQFKSAWIRPNIVVVECEVPVSELTSGYKAERAKDAVGEVDWKSGSVSGEVYKQTGRARKVILSRWCKPVRVLDDAEVAQRAKEFVGDAKVEIPENVLTPKQRIAFEEAGFKIGAPEKGVKKSEQIADALKAGLQIDNSVREFRSKKGEVYGFVANGEIHLDTKKMKPETPLHEYTHLWTSALQRVNAKEWENVKSLLDSVDGLKEEVQKLYPELKGDDLYDEMLATYSGREGTKKLEETARNIAAEEGKSLEDSVKAKSFLSKVKEAVKKYWNGVADMLHVKFTSAEEVADKVLADWTNGVNPNEIKQPSSNPLETLKRSAEEYKQEASGEKTRLQKASVSDIEATASEHGVDASLLTNYANAMKEKNSAAAFNALHDLRANYLREHFADKKAIMERDGVSSLIANRRMFAPIEKAIKEKYGDVDVLREEVVRRAEEERNLMGAARKRTEEEMRKREERLAELAELTDEEIDKRYADALEKGDEAAAREMLDEAARRKGYGDAESNYQGVGAWAAPSNPGYATDAERRAEVEGNGTDVNVEDISLGYSPVQEDMFSHPERTGFGDQSGIEAGRAINNALEALRAGQKDVKIKVYRAVPTSVKEGKLRNGDWVTPSRAYAEMHGDHRLDGKYRIIEDEVPAKELWFDGNDVREWGYDNGKDYRYRNVKNNRKSNDLVTRDDKGNIIPPSKRFNSRKADERYQMASDSGVQAPSPQEKALTEVLTEAVGKAGIEVVTDVEAGQRMLDMANGEATLSKGQKRALETASVSQDEKHQQTVVSSADGAKVLNNLDNLASVYEKSQQTKEKTFLGEIAKALGAQRHGSTSQYATFETKNGNIVTIRLANHNARVSTFDNNGEAEGISIVVSPKKNAGMTGDGRAHVVEYYYDAIKLRRADGKPLAEIVRSIKQALYSGEFKDTTGLAQREEVNADRVREQRVFHGSGADFSHFDHSHMGEGEGAQAYGWGTYVTEVEGIGRTYAKASADGHASQDFYDAYHNYEKAKERYEFVMGSYEYVIERWNAAKGGKDIPELEAELKKAKEVGDEQKADDLEWEIQLSRDAVDNKAQYDSEYIPQARQQLDEAKAAYDKLKPTRHLYTVEIPEDNGGNYLDYDSKPSKEQIDRIQKGLAHLFEEGSVLPEELRKKMIDWNNGYEPVINVTGDMTGHQIYEHIAQNVLDSNASRLLNSVGFTGIKYHANYRSGGRTDGASNYVIFNEADAKITDHVRFFKTPNGEAYGYTVGGKIYIDPRIATAETPIHEYAHLWAEALRDGNAKEWENVVGLMKGTSVWDEVKKQYPELKSDSDIADEVIAQYSGRRGAERLREEQRKIAEGEGSASEKAAAISALEGVKQSLKKFWQGVCDFLHIHYTSAEEVADRVMKDLLDGVNPLSQRFNEGSNDVRYSIADGKDGGTHFRTEADGYHDAHTPVVVKNVDKLSKKLGSPINMVNSPEEVTNPVVKARLEKGENVTGWYDEKTGEVHLYMPNVHDSYTAEKTIWHETVGHKGMRGLFGDKFDDFLRSIYYDLDKPENAELKKLVDEERKYNPLNIYDAIEEGIARLAEEGKGEQGFWNNIKNKVTDLLHEIGYRVAPNTKDVKYLLWLAKNRQKNPNSPYWKLKENAARESIARDSKPAVAEHGGMFFGDGKARDLESMSKQEFQEATDGQIHFRTSPAAATAIDRYHKALDAHGYMFTESYMDNMLSLKNLMQAIKPDVKKIEDIKASENPYVLQNTMQGAMSNAAEMFERNVMQPLSKSMSDVLDAFGGAKDEDKIRNFNLYMIKKHGLERNRVFFVRDYIGGLEKADADILRKQWNAEKKDLGDQLRRNAIRLDEYYDKMDDWIRNNVDATYNAGEHDYSGFHGLYDLERSDPYNDKEVVNEVMSSEANMESVKKGSVADFWNNVNAATQYSLDCDYKNGLVSKETHDNVSGMFDYYVPLRKFDETTAEDVYGYVTEKGDPSSFIGSTLMNAKGRKSLSETNILAQIGAMGNNAINRGGKNAIKQAFARFVRNNGGQGLVTEVNSWVELVGYDVNHKPIWKEAFPQIPENATPDKVAKIVSDFESDMQAKKAKGEAVITTNKGNIGFKFERAKDKSQHIVDVKIAGKTHSFVINGNPRAAQALNGLLENWNGSNNKVMKWGLGLNGKITRFFAQACTSYNPEFVTRNMIKDYEFASLNLLAKEGARYTATFEKYYLALNNIAGVKNISLSDFKDGDGFGLFAKYRNGTLGNGKIENYFREFMENGGETGFVQMLSMKDWTKKYKAEISSNRSNAAKAGKILKDGLFGTIEGLNEVAENMARFATYCTSRDHGRSVVRSAYDAKEASVNFNRKGSGSAIISFKNGEMSYAKAAGRNFLGFTAWYLRHASMFFNAGIQSTNLLLKNAKNAPVATAGIIATAPFALAVLMPLVNKTLMGMLDDDEKDRKGVKDPYSELPDYVRRNNLCIYTGGGEFATIPLAIETRAFYGLGDLAADMLKNPKDRDIWDIAKESTGQIAQLVPIMDYMGSKDFSENPLEATFQAISPSSIEPLIEWERNKDWKGQQIERRGSFYENEPAWMRANSGTNKFLIGINQKANAYTNDVAKGNEEMLGSNFLDQITNPSMIEHFGSGITKGMGTFGGKVVGAIKSVATGEEMETKDKPFIRSFFYTPSETTSMQRTKSKFYNYADELDKDMANVRKLRREDVEPGKHLRNVADYENFMNSKRFQQVQIMEDAQKEVKRIKQMRKRQTDTEVIRFADEEIGRVMQEAVEKLDKLNE